MKGITLLWGAIGMFVIGAAALIFISPTARPPENRPGQEIADQGTKHITVGSEHPVYNSNPPTSGWHYAEEADWGVHVTEVPDEQAIHNLEHGGIWISYKDIDQETLAKIEDLARRYPNKLLVTPRAANDAKIAVASWRRLMNLESFDEAAVIAFIQANKNRSPEPNAI